MVTVTSSNQTELSSSSPRFFLSSASVFSHSVTVVGLGTSDLGAFWRVKNTWGSSWGEQGYLRIARGRGHCGIGSTYAVPNCQLLNSG